MNFVSGGDNRIVATTPVYVERTAIEERASKRRELVAEHSRYLER